MTRAKLIAAAAALAAALVVAAPAFGAADQPNWKYFASHPPLDGVDTDRRIIGCFPASASPAIPCDRDERSTAAAAPNPWDTLASSSSPTFTTSGNNAHTELAGSNPVAPSPGFAPISATRDYVYPWTDSWRNATCNPANFAGVPSSGAGTDANDINAAIVNLFAGHNRLHDWSYNLGFTEARYNLQASNPAGTGGAGGDRMVGNAQAGPLTAGLTFAGRDAANQTTPADGTPVSVDAHLWQPVGGAYYPRCTDEDFDMSLIAHDYAHAIANRMVGGAAAGLTSSADGQARAIGEGFADLAAVEFLNEYGYAPGDDEDPFTVGSYVTGAKGRGVRNYSMAASPLNYSNLRGWDTTATEAPHDDGEIWAAVNHDIRQALVAKYDGAFPAGDAALQRSCADGRTPVGQCPGNRRWIQLLFDANLLMPAAATMIDARDALVAADQARFGGANAAELWTAFARRGLGDGAASPGTEASQPEPGFTSPVRSDESTLIFGATAAGAPGAPAVPAELFLGDYEAGATPVADTDPATPLDDRLDLVPGTYRFVVRADEHGSHRLERTVPASSDVTLNVGLPANRASGAAGAVATGDGARTGDLIDDTEGTNWEAVGQDPVGRQVTVALAGGAQVVDRVNVSALVQGRDNGNEAETGGHQNRFTALRQFQLQACTASPANSNCSAGGFSTFYTSPVDAFPGHVPRPVVPELSLRSFNVPDTSATHVRLVVLNNQCTGSVLFNTEQENDPATPSDCRATTGPIPRMDRAVRAAELQVFSGEAEVTQSNAPKPQDQAPTGGGGGAGGGGVGAGALVTDLAPAVSGLRLSRRRFRLGRRLPRVAVKTGTTIRFRLSEPARVTLAFARARVGRRVGRACRLRSRALRRPRCRRYVRAGSMGVRARQGTNSLRFEGRLSRRRLLKPGAYRLSITAVDPSGRRSSPRTAKFRLLPRRAR